MSGVEPQKPEKPGELAQMRIAGERHLTQGLAPDPQKFPDIETLEYRVNRDPIAIPQAVLKAHGFPIGQDQLHLHVGNAQSLDDILHRGLAGELIGKGTPPEIRGQKVVEFRVETKFGFPHLQTENGLGPRQIIHGENDLVLLRGKIAGKHVYPLPGQAIQHGGQLPRLMGEAHA